MIGRLVHTQTHLALTSGPVSGPPEVGASQRSFLLFLRSRCLAQTTQLLCHQSPLHTIASQLQLSPFFTPGT